MMRMAKNAWDWFDDRTGTSMLLGPVLRHPVPRGLGWPYTLGSATLMSFIIQVITGIALATAYVSSTGEAYNSLVFITHQAAMGYLLRGMHFWGASAMVLLIGLHTLRVFLYGAYKFPREVSWLSGAVLLLLTLGLAFTGQLLRWDQTAYWSVAVATRQVGEVPVLGDILGDLIRGGATVGGQTLSRFFAVHVFFIPAGVFLFIGLHLWLVIRNGISNPPKVGDVVDPKTERAKYHNILRKEGEPFWPNAVFYDAVGMLVVLAVVVLLATFVGPPELGGPPDPTNLVAYPRPDWYLLWYFAVLALLPGGIEGWVIIFGPVLLGVLLFALPFFANKGERNWRRRPWAVAFTVMVITIIGVFWLLGEQASWSPAFDTQPLSAQVVNSTDPKVVHGGSLFYERGCQFCHNIDGNGGHRGPELTTVGSRLNRAQLITRILNGGNNMPAYGAALDPADLDDLVAFLQSRTGGLPTPAPVVEAPQPASP